MMAIAITWQMSIVAHQIGIIIYNIKNSIVLFKVYNRNKLFENLLLRQKLEMNFRKSLRSTHINQASSKSLRKMYHIYLINQLIK